MARALDYKELLDFQMQLCIIDLSAMSAGTSPCTRMQERTLEWNLKSRDNPATLTNHKSRRHHDTKEAHETMEHFLVLLMKIGAGKSQVKRP